MLFVEWEVWMRCFFVIMICCLRIGYILPIVYSNNLCVFCEVGECDDIIWTDIDDLGFLVSNNAGQFFSNN